MLCPRKKRRRRGALEANARSRRNVRATSPAARTAKPRKKKAKSLFEETL